MNKTIIIIPFTLTTFQESNSYTCVIADVQSFGLNFFSLYIDMLLFDEQQKRLEQNYKREWIVLQII